MICTVIHVKEPFVEGLLDHFPSVNDLLTATLQDLERVSGMTPQRALKLYALFQIAIELNRPKTPTYIRSPQDVYDLIATDLQHLQQEHFVCIYLNVKNSVIGQATLAIGSLNATIVHPREIFKLAMRRSSASIICVHNHPSGDPTPSPQDIDLTKRLIVAGEIIGIDVLDHVVIGGGKYVSMREQGLV